MMLREASLSRRLLLGAGGFIALALVLAAVVLYFVLHRFVQGQIDQRLDSQIVFLSSMLRADRDGTLALSGSADGPPFDRPRRGWYWQITGPKNSLRAGALAEADVVAPDIRARPRPPPPPRDADGPRWPFDQRPIPADGPGPGLGPDDQALHFRIQPVSVSGMPTTIVVTAPRAAVLGPLREAMTTLAISLVVLGGALALAMLLQVRLGLRPLARLRDAVADVRAGRSERVPSAQPREVQPLVSELNGLLAQNATNLERARRHVANLAHGLKTPLATLAVALPTAGPQSGRSQELHDLVDLMERRIRHHLGRARAAALSGPVRAQTAIAPRIADLCAVLGKVNADKPIAIVIDIPAALAVACEQQDFDEMAGNLLENAFTWTRSRLDIRASADNGRGVVLTIADDGPGLQPDKVSNVMLPGQRLDESVPGFGFGLSITRELAELYGGALELGAAPAGGLCVSLQLPLGSGRT
jgi:signal transduction histidine kinase